MNEKEEPLDTSISEPEISKVDIENEPNLHEDSPSSEGDEHDGPEDQRKDGHHPRQVPMTNADSKGDSDKDVHSPSSEGDNRHGTDKQRKSRRRPRRHKGGKRHRRPYSRPDGGQDGHLKQEDLPPLHSIATIGAPFNTTQYLMSIRETEDDKNCSPRLDEYMSPAKYMDRLQRDYSDYPRLDETVWNKFQTNPDLIVPCGRVLVEEKSKEELIEENCNLKKTVMELRTKLAGITDETPDFLVDNTSNAPSPACSVDNVGSPSLK